ncbi:winged helix-turn-helix domain-containing protein [Acidimangrovimonas pyrenivorans]|uniref:Winged helix-turn-helix domain-containing protein n=1 Tax=Acidimangrovimonas pyrenivorans TaxID=2030798 RepID=A0ABV7ACZ8_9RHOB
MSQDAPETSSETSPDRPDARQAETGQAETGQADTATAAAADPEAPRLRLRLVFGSDLVLGPGKADLLELIRDTGSISAAGRRMRMSYKRAWLLVEEMNAAFRSPVVESTRGGAQGGGAQLTETGETVLAAFRGFEAEAARAGAEQIAALRGLLRPAEGDAAGDGGSG